MIEARTLDLGPGGMRIDSQRPLAPDELLEFELPERARINGRARVLREQGYRIYALRFEKLGDEARAEIAELASLGHSCSRRLPERAGGLEAGLSRTAHCTSAALCALRCRAAVVSSSAGQRA